MKQLLLSTIVQDQAARRPHAVCAVVGPQQCCTYGDAHQAMQAHERAIHAAMDTLLLSQWQTCHDVVIAYLADNCLDLALSVLAATTVARRHDGKVAVALLNTRWTLHEIAQVLVSPSPSNDSIPATLFIHGPSYAAVARHVQPRVANVTCRSLPDFAMSRLRPLLPTTAISGPDQESIFHYKSILQHARTDDALIVFTSGTTTGHAQGVRLGHQALLLQMYSKITMCGYNATTAVAASSALPLYHVGGLSSLLATWMAGGRWIMTTNAIGFDAAAMFHSMTPMEHDSTKLACVNTLAVVPAMIHAMQQAQGADAAAHHYHHHHYPQVQLVLIGGQSASHPALAWLRTTFPQARLWQTYACSEAASSLTFHNVTVSSNVADDDDDHDDASVVGRPAPYVQIKLLRSAQPDAVAIQDSFITGTIAFAGPMVMNGYWQRGGHDTIKKRGETWIVTSDLGYWDDGGRLCFAGRRADWIRTGGETVVAGHVEKVVQQHAAVQECAILGVPDDRLGEMVACAVVVRDGTALSLADVQQWCQEYGLARYKLPRRLLTVKDLPKTATGKVIKAQLRERFAVGAQSESRL